MKTLSPMFDLLIKVSSKTALWVGGAVLLLSLTGCMSPGKQLERSAVGQLHKGMPRAEVHKIFGKPVATESGPDDEFLEDYRMEFNLPRFANSYTVQGTFTWRCLQVIYQGKEPVVVEFHHHEGHVPYRQLGNGNLQTGMPNALARVGSLKQGETTLSDLVAWFGEPHIVELDLAREKVYSWVFVELRANHMSGQKLMLVLDDRQRVKDFRVKAVNE